MRVSESGNQLVYIVVGAKQHFSVKESKELESILICMVWLVKYVLFTLIHNMKIYLTFMTYIAIALV